MSTTDTVVAAWHAAHNSPAVAHDDAYRGIWVPYGCVDAYQTPMRLTAWLLRAAFGGCCGT
jgi:hypothetical protein